MARVGGKESDTYSLKHHAIQPTKDWADRLGDRAGEGVGAAIMAER